MSVMPETATPPSPPRGGHLCNPNDSVLHLAAVAVAPKMV